MARLWTNSIRGKLSSGITDTDTTLDSPIFAELPAVSSPDTLRLTLDPSRQQELGKPEIVEVTSHSASSTSVTVTRAVETSNNGGSAQAWPSGTTVVHALTSEGVSSFVPTGIIVMWSGTVSNVPSGWALCDGNNGTPDLRDRFVVAAGSSYSVDDTGGSDTVRLDTEHIPDHSHAFSLFNQGAHVHGVRTRNVTQDSADQEVYAPESAGSQDADGVGFLESGDTGADSTSTGEHDHSGSTDSDGGGGVSPTEHENRPAFYALAFIMRL